jgi:transposase-like protein
MESGAICIGRLTTMAIWLILGFAEKRNMEAAQTFFKQAVAVVGSVPDPVTTDGHTSYPRAIRETMGSHIQHRMSKYLNNRLEQDRRGIKQR